MCDNPPACGEFDNVAHQVLQTKWECNQVLREVLEQVGNHQTVVVAVVRQVRQGVLRLLGSVLERVGRQVCQGRQVVVLLLVLRWAQVLVRQLGR